MDYYSLIMIVVFLSLITLSILMIENNRISSEKKKLFLITNLIVALAAASEWAGLYISGHENIPGGYLVAVKAADYIFTPLIGGMMILIAQKTNSRSRLLEGLFAGNIVLQIVSAFTGWMVVIDEHNHYSHGVLYPVYMAFYLLVILLLLVKMLVYGKTFRKQNRISLYATIALILFGIAAQEILGGEYRICYLVITFGVAFLFIHYSEFSQIQMEDELSDQQLKLSNDALTGVYSRFAYIDSMNAYKDVLPKDFVVFLIDINGLKEVNDSLGHEAGDELICGAARCIDRSLGKYGKTYRIGGDEFVVFAAIEEKRLPGAIEDLDEHTNVWSGERVEKLSMSVGCARAENYEGFTVEELVKEADKAMYRQKKEYYQRAGLDRRNRIKL